MLDSHAIWQGAQSGVGRAFGLLIVVSVAAVSHRIASDSFAKTSNPYVTATAALGCVLALAALSAYTLGQTRDCSAADGLWIGCDVTEILPVGLASRWEAFFTTALLLLVPASVGAKAGLALRGTRAADTRAQGRQAITKLIEWSLVAAATVAAFALLYWLLGWATDALGWLSIIAVPIILMLVVAAALGGMIFLMRARERARTGRPAP